MVYESMQQFENYGTIAEVFTILKTNHQSNKHNCFDHFRTVESDSFMKAQPLFAAPALPELSHANDTVELNSRPQMVFKHRSDPNDKCQKEPLLLNIETNNGPSTSVLNSSNTNSLNNSPSKRSNDEAIDDEQFLDTEKNNNSDLNKQQAANFSENHQFNSNDCDMFMHNNLANNFSSNNNTNNNNNNDTVIGITDQKENRSDMCFPREIFKTFLAFVILVFSFLMTSTSIALVHDLVPDRDKYGPLPDIFLNHVPVRNWALNISEYLIVLSMYSTMLLIFCHRHRWIVMRRVFLIMSLLYIMRAITMYVTALPIPNTSYYCAPKDNHTTPIIIITRVLHIVSGFGLSVSGKIIYCGDNIYSGHTVTLVLSYLIISEYSPKRFYILHWASKCVTIIGVFFVLLSHGHYTIDVIIAYYITTRSFWTYHTLANNLTMKSLFNFNVFAEFSRPFVCNYKCYSVLMLPGNERQDVHQGGKIIMPASALEQLTRQQIFFPMLFKLTNKKTNTSTHCGVLEFIAEEGRVHIPSWMMRNLMIDEGESLQVESVSLPVATYSKFQAQSVDFLDISNPKAVLEKCLRNFACLTTGDKIPINYNKQLYELCVMETKPGRAVTIIECDMNVEFVPPVGYKEPEKPDSVNEGMTDFDDSYQSSSFATDRNTDRSLNQGLGADVKHDDEKEKFEVFSGSGNRLDGKRKSSSQLKDDDGTHRGNDQKAHSTKVRGGVADYAYEVGFIRFFRNQKQVKSNNQEADPSFKVFGGEGHTIRSK